jgi:hypothetical protein
MSLKQQKKKMRDALKRGVQLTLKKRARSEHKRLS